MIRLTLYGRADCHLCHEMRAVVQSVARERELEVEEVDVDTDPALVAAYGAEVPVLCVNGRKAFKYRVERAALCARLAREPG
jgi:glutaredoxin